MPSFRNFARTTFVGRLLLIPWRLKNAMLDLLPPLGRAIIWSIRSREHHNYTYDLTEMNRSYLTAFVSNVTDQPFDTISGYMRELDSDVALKEHIQKLTRNSKERFVADPIASFGRRMGWYAMVRASKPRLVVETGIDKGLGSCLLSAALFKNSQEGNPGRLIAVDINPDAGYLIRPPYDELVDVVHSDSITALQKISAPIDFFIHDSDHSPQHEQMEIDSISENLSERAFILSDNAHVTTKLLEFANKSGRRFLFFREEPKNHWYSGDGIGVAFGPQGQQSLQR